MRLLYVYNLNHAQNETEAEFDAPEEIERWQKDLAEFGEVRSVEFESPLGVVAALSGGGGWKPDLVVNMAEGHVGSSREAFVPVCCENLKLPYTGSGPATFMITLDKDWTKREVERLGAMRVPQGVRVEPGNVRNGLRQAGRLRFPLIVKPNLEGSSKGIRADSVVDTPAALAQIVERTMAEYPGPVLVEEYIVGLDVFVPYLEIFRDTRKYGVPHPEVLDPFDVVPDKLVADRGRHFVYDYEAKTTLNDHVDAQVPARLDPDVLEDIRARCARIYKGLGIRDVGRIDLRVTSDGTPYFIEANALPAIGIDGMLCQCAERRAGLNFDGVVRAIVQSALRRYRLV
ncbi:hypothetical protein A3C96_02455 [Candidatus Uhrbacteria bacterium RIFCSPHIGHO2_02_FULL_60_10]|uniref:ATP-grasp domain-containing protein n=1 Tax=Candidatus Uhrbacteria bacterium RIFCSPHIGHO2_02_FULL_60_10 TaxID=1802392 RepID=A0A1F7U7Y1_9BACT|nr:MAG: hypothetical protein A3C96_02455 [Candidatus Uhrbacteria bacterium RIFCSPHIGHO2_02_FULL_60_10]